MKLNKPQSLGMDRTCLVMPSSTVVTIDFQVRTAEEAMIMAAVTMALEKVAVAADVAAVMAAVTLVAVAAITEVATVAARTELAEATAKVAAAMVAMEPQTLC